MITDMFKTESTASDPKYLEDLRKNGYAIIPNVITPEERYEAEHMFGNGKRRFLTMIICTI